MDPLSCRAAALTAWLWALPGAVRDPGSEQVALAQRGVEDLKMAFAGKGMTESL